MQTIRPTKEQISFKQHETYLQDARDQLCKHYNLNKSDLVKFLIKKETYILKRPHETWSYQWEVKASVNWLRSKRRWSVLLPIKLLSGHLTRCWRHHWIAIGSNLKSRNYCRKTFYNSTSSQVKSGNISQETKGATARAICAWCTFLHFAHFTILISMGWP